MYYALGAVLWIIGGVFEFFYANHVLTLIFCVIAMIVFAIAKSDELEKRIEKLEKK
jgi:FtsH-binding integral membrane protein